MKAPVAVGDVVAGKYRVERILAAGGMGVVVAARHLALDQPVALKFMLSELLSQPYEPDAVERFLREGRAVARLRGENVARVHDVGTLDDDGATPYMVMEYLEGTDLEDLLIERRVPLALATAVDYVLQACLAMAEAHASGIVHRDLKPDNLFLTRRPDGSPLVKVLDFGISKLYEVADDHEATRKITRHAAVMGSPAYMPPEQARSARSVDARSDIWSLGVILYELTSRRLPYDTSVSTAEFLAQLIYQTPRPLADAAPGLPPAFCAVVDRCLRKDPTERFRNVAELAGSLAPFAGPAGAGLVRSIRATLGREASATQDVTGHAAAGQAGHAGRAGGDTGADTDTLLAGTPGTGAGDDRALGRSALASPDPAAADDDFAAALDRVGSGDLIGLDGSGPDAAAAGPAAAEPGPPGDAPRADLAPVRPPPPDRRPSGPAPPAEVPLDIIDIDRDALRRRPAAGSSDPLVAAAAGITEHELDARPGAPAPRLSRPHRTPIRRGPGGDGGTRAAWLDGDRVVAATALAVLGVLTAAIVLTGAEYIGVDRIDRLIHAAGHAVLGGLDGPVGLLSGSLFQVFVPLGVLAALNVARRPVAAAVALWWLGENAVHVARYIADAPYQARLPIAGDVHPFAELLDRWDAIDHAGRIATIGQISGWVVMIAALVVILRRGLLRR